MNKIQTNGWSIKIKDKKMTNSNGICKHCLTKSIRYGIENGSYTYFCEKCNKELSKNEVIDENLFINRLTKKGNTRERAIEIINEAIKSSNPKYILHYYQII